MTRYDIHLIKPTRYDDDGYPLQWYRSLIPSNSLACVAGLVHDAIAREALGANVEPHVHIVDETHTMVDPDRMIARHRQGGGSSPISSPAPSTSRGRSGPPAFPWRSAVSTSPAACRCSTRCRPI